MYGERTYMKFEKVVIKNFRNFDTESQSSFDMGDIAGKDMGY